MRLPGHCLPLLSLLLLLAACGAPAASPTAAPVAPAAIATTPPTPTSAPATATPPRPTPTATSMPATTPTAPASTATATPAAQPAAKATASAPGEVRVTMAGLTFRPGTLTVPVGTTVVWFNDDTVIHNVVHKDLQTFSSPILSTGESFRYTFTKAGDYPYLCTIHPEMVATITVR